MLTATCLLLRVFLFHDKISQVAIGLIAFGLIANTAAVTSLGTVRSPTTAGFLLLVILAGLLLELRELILTVFLSSLAVLVLIIMEGKGLLYPADFSVNITQWIVYTTMFCLCGGFTYQSIRKVLDRLHGEIDGQGNTTHFVAVKKDITDKKELENMKEDIERIMRHDLKTPLNSIIGYPQLLINTDLDDRQEKFVRNIEQAGYTMLQIIELYLNMFKMEAGTYDLEPVPLDLIDILKGVLVDLELQVRTKQIQFDLTINRHPPDEFDVCSITGEKTLYYSILSNLIKNAIEASPENNQVKIDVSPQSSVINIEIVNQGVVPEEIRERFFDKYVSFGKQKGTGLGTYSARLMTETLGGSIAMQTSEAQGTRITVTIPG